MSVKFNKPEPRVNRFRQVEHIDLSGSGRDKLLELIKSGKDFEMTVAQIAIKETIEEMIARIKREEKAYNSWLEEKEKWEVEVRQQRELKKKQEKQERNKKYDDPEYLEYLRLQAKLQKKGVI